LAIAVRYGLPFRSKGASMNRVPGALALCLTVTACVSGGGSSPATPPSPSAAYRSTAVAAGAECAHGGVRVDVGVDDDRSGTLDPAEVDRTEYVCSGEPGAAGADGAAALVRVVAELPGPACPAGGVRVEAGVDDDGDGVLDDAEVDSSEPVCGARSAGGPAPVPAEWIGDRLAASGELAAPDLQLADGTRADLWSFTLDAPGFVDALAPGVELHLFTSACLGEPDVSAWGPCFVGTPGTVRLEAGDYLALVKGTPGTPPWVAVPYALTLARWSSIGAAGAPDAAFGEDGVACAVVATPYAWSASVAFQGDALVVAGIARSTAIGLSAVRFGVDGALDATFGVGGVLAAGSATIGASFGSLSVEEGGLVLSGMLLSAYPGVGTVVRASADGVLDATFGAEGQAVLPLGATPVSAVATADGGVLALAYGSSNRLLVRYGPDGTPDPSFGVDGVAVIGQGSADSLLGDPDGGAWVASSSSGKGTGRGDLAKYDAAGALDPAFHGDGIVDLGPGDVLGFERRGSGFAVFAAERGLEKEGDYALHVSLVDAGGSVTSLRYPLPPGFYPAGAALAPADRFVVAGPIRRPDGTMDAAVLRFRLDGEPDRAFGEGGEVRLPGIGAASVAVRGDELAVALSPEATGTSFCALRLR
jgi:uncharacterized delta-60 repeat protein